MKRIYSIAFLFFLSLMSFGTTPPMRDYTYVPVNAVRTSYGYSPMMQTFNATYSRILTVNRHADFYMNYSAGYFIGNDEYGWKGATGYHTTITLDWIRGTNYNFFEAAIGGVLFYDMAEWDRIKADDYRENKFTKVIVALPAFYIGYRFIKPYGKFFWRAGVGFPEQAAFGVGYKF